MRYKVTVRPFAAFFTEEPFIATAETDEVAKVVDAVRDAVRSCLNAVLAGAPNVDPLNLEYNIAFEKIED